jgi:hypothetical protein
MLEPKILVVQEEEEEDCSHICDSLPYARVLVQTNYDWVAVVFCLKVLNNLFFPGGGGGRRGTKVDLTQNWSLFRNSVACSTTHSTGSVYFRHVSSWQKIIGWLMKPSDNIPTGSLHMKEQLQ